MKTVLVTGATGFVGRRLVARLCESQGVTQVVGLGRAELPGVWDRFIEVDLGVAGASIDMCGVSTVFHLAGKAHAVGESEDEISGYKEIIVEGTRRVVDDAERFGVHALIYVSSVKAMGEGESCVAPDAPIDEQTPAEPESPYGRCKLEAESIVLQSRIPHVVVLRPVMVFGPGQKGNLVRMAQAIQGGRFPPVAETHNRRSMVHVDDVVAACELAEGFEPANREVYIISNGSSLSTREIYDKLRLEMGLRPVGWSVPPIVILTAAKIGDILGKVTGKCMPLDSESVHKLLGSAWYSGQKSMTDLGLVYREGCRLLE